MAGTVVITFQFVIVGIEIGGAFLAMLVFIGKYKQQDRNVITNTMPVMITVMYNMVSMFLPCSRRLKAAPAGFTYQRAVTPPHLLNQAPGTLPSKAFTLLLFCSKALSPSSTDTYSLALAIPEK